MVEPAPSADLLQRIQGLLGAPAVGWLPPGGGYSTAERWSLHLADGRRVFVKTATNGELAGALRREHRNLRTIEGDFHCQVLAWEGGRRPLLIVEDLSHGRWPPPWRPGDVERVLATLERIWSTPPPAHFRSAETLRERLSSWQRFGRDPSRFLDLGLATSAWLRGCLPQLIEAERAAILDGPDLLHLDVRSDNICLLEDRVVLVDWSWSCRGPRALDLAGWLPSLYREGGPRPDELLPDGGPYAAALSGYWADRASLPPPPTAPGVRDLQLAQLRVALPWACRALGLPPPDLL